MDVVTHVGRQAEMILVKNSENGMLPFTERSWLAARARKLRNHNHRRL